jgi:hypothetical protein
MFRTNTAQFFRSARTTSNPTITSGRSLTALTTLLQVLLVSVDQASAQNNTSLPTADLDPPNSQNNTGIEYDKLALSVGLTAGLFLLCMLGAAYLPDRYEPAVRCCKNKRQHDLDV